MKSLPQVEDTLLIRTDFSDDAAWQALWTTVTTPTEEGFLACVHLVDDPYYQGWTVEQLMPSDPEDTFFIIADETAVTSPEMPLLAIYEIEGQVEQLRVAARALHSIENNLSLANMDWEEFVNGADDDGVFRGVW